MPDNTNFRFHCEICDVHFNCDLDVSRHLHSESHIKQRDDHERLHQQPKISEKDIPKTLRQVLRALKLRSVRDVRDLADKGYFEIRDDLTADIADRLASYLTRAVISFDSENLPENTRKLFLKQFEEKEETENEILRSGQSKGDYLPAGSETAPERSASSSPSLLAKFESTIQEQEVRAPAPTRAIRAPQTTDTQRQPVQGTPRQASQPVPRPGPLSRKTNAGLQQPEPRQRSKQSNNRGQASEMRTDRQSNPAQQPIPAAVRQAQQVAPQRQAQQQQNSSIPDQRATQVQTLLPMQSHLRPEPRPNSNYTPILAKIIVKKEKPDN